MSLTRTRAQIRTDVRRASDSEGTSRTERFPDAELDDYIDQGRAAFYRLLTGEGAHDRLIASATATTASGTSTYTLTSSFSVTDLLSLISVDMDAEGRKTWLTPFEWHERPGLSDTNVTATGVPQYYKLRGDTLELLPAPGGAYTITIWYVPHQSAFASDGATMDTIQRLDAYVTYWATREIALKDKHWDLHDRMTGRLKELESDVRVAARNRDMNHPPRPVDVRLARAYPAHWRRR